MDNIPGKPDTPNKADVQRKSKRAPFNARLSIESLYLPGMKEPVKFNADIQLTDISKTGIGFISQVEFPTDHFFNSKIVINDEKTFYCVLRIVRTQKINDGWRIGSEFVGLADLIGEYIKDYVEDADG